MENNNNEIILAFIGEPTYPDSNITRTSHGYDAFVCTEHSAINNLFRSLCMWGGSTNTYVKDGKFYNYYELNCRDREFFKSDIFKRICKPYGITITICESGEELYNKFYHTARIWR